MSACQLPNGGCLHVEEANACPLCDEDGADRIAEWANGDESAPSNDGPEAGMTEDWMRQRTPEEIRQDMIEGAKALGASAAHAERFVAHLTGEKPMSDQEMVRMILEAGKEG